MRYLELARYWLKSQPYHGDPLHWILQAAIRYDLSDAQVYSLRDEFGVKG